MDLREDIKQRWNQAASWFQQHEEADPNRNDLLFPKLLTTLEASLGAFSGRSILDAGCGDGRFAKQLASRGAQVVGVDFSATLQAAQHSSPSGNPRFIQCDLVELKTRFPKSHQFDAIVCILVLQGAILVAEILKEFSRLLKSQGILIVVVHDSKTVQPDSAWFAQWQCQDDVNDPDGGTTHLVHIDLNAKPVYYFHRSIDTYRVASGLDLVSDVALPAATKFLDARPRLGRLKNKSLFRLLVSKPALAGEWREQPISQLTGCPGHGGAVLNLLSDCAPSASVAIRAFRKLDPIVAGGDCGGDLYVIFEGNAVPYSSPMKLDQLLASLKPTMRVNTLLRNEGEFVRYILCPGQLIGEFECLFPRPFAANVLAGTPFELISTRRSQEETVCRVIRIPARLIKDCSKQSTFQVQFQKLIYESFDHKLATLVHLISLADRGTVTQLLYLLWLCFNRWSPVTAYELSDGTRYPTATDPAQLIFPRDVNVPADRQGEITAITVHNKFLEFMLGGRELSASVNILQGHPAARTQYQDGEKKFDIAETVPGASIKTWRITINQDSSLPQIWTLLHGEKSRTT